MAVILGNTRNLAILLIGVVGGVLVGFLLLRVLLGGASNTAAPAAPVRVEYEGATYQVKDRIYNLADPNARRYLKLALALQFSSETDKFETAKGEGYATLNNEFAAEIAPKAPAIQDALTSIVSAKTMAQVLTAEGKDQLKQEISTKLSAIFGREHHLTKVYFTDFVVQ